jgi:tetratricopeptide (TPR) repeat protein
LALALFAAVPAAAQVDAITKEARKDPFILVRLAALSLRTPAEQGEALAGLVQAELQRGQLKDAVGELKRIIDGYWLATALVKLSDYHGARKRSKLALDALRRATRALRSVPVNAETIALRREIALRHNTLNDIDGAIDVAKAIPERLPRIEVLRELGRRDADNKPSAGAKRALVEASHQARAIKDNDSEVARLLLLIGQAQTKLNDIKQAAATLNQARRMILEGQFSGRDLALAELAAAQTQAGDQTRAMVLVRTIKDPEKRVRALGSIARAIGESGNMDAAVTLFTFAFETASGIADNALRRSLIAHLAIEQTRAGRLADAFRTVAYIRMKKMQAETIFTMSEVLLEKGRFAEALRLTDYIPYIGMRGSIYARVALARGEGGDAIAASALLAKALEPVGEMPDADRLEAALDLVLDTQIKVGDPNTAAALFERAQNMIDSLPGGLDRVRLLTTLARAYAQSDDKAAAERVIAAAWRITWGKSQQRDYPRSIARIVEALIATGKLLDAFNAAARIPETEIEDEMRASQKPRNRSLTLVAQAAARMGKVQLAIRAARKIKDPASRAAALAAIAIGISQS